MRTWALSASEADGILLVLDTLDNVGSAANEEEMPGLLIADFLERLKEAWA